MIGARCFYHLQFDRISTGRDHGCAQVFTELDSGQAHAAAGTVYQQGFTALQLTTPHQRNIRGDCGHLKCRAFGKIEGIG